MLFIIYVFIKDKPFLAAQRKRRRSVFLE